jgi:hypothetical protein
VKEKYMGIRDGWITTKSYYTLTRSRTLSLEVTNKWAPKAMHVSEPVLVKKAFGWFSCSFKDRTFRVNLTNTEEN